MLVVCHQPTRRGFRTGQDRGDKPIAQRPGKGEFRDGQFLGQHNGSLAALATSDATAHVGLGGPRRGPATPVLALLAADERVSRARVRQTQSRRPWMLALVDRSPSGDGDGPSAVPAVYRGTEGMLGRCCSPSTSMANG